MWGTGTLKGKILFFSEKPHMRANSFLCKDVDNISMLVISLVSRSQLLKERNNSFWRKFFPLTEGELRIIQRKFLSFLNKNIHYDPSLEPSQQDGSNEGSL